MSITTFSQLNAGNLLKAGGTAAISNALANMLRRQRRSTLDTDHYLYREGDGFTFRIDLSTPEPRVTLLRGVLCNTGNNTIVYFDRVPMKGYKLIEVAQLDGSATDEKSSLAGRIVKNLRELTAISGMFF